MTRPVTVSIKCRFDPPRIGEDSQQPPTRPAAGIRSEKREKAKFLLA